MPQQVDLHIRRLCTGSVFRIVATGAFFSIVPFAALMGIFALFGFGTITWNNEPVTGLTGLVASPFIGAFVAAIFTGFFGVLFSFGLWLYSKIKPLHLKAMADAPPNAEAEK